MADPGPAGSDVSSGTYKCTKCGYELKVGSTKNLHPAPAAAMAATRRSAAATQRTTATPTAKG